jgi:hypothetical protein
MTRHTRAACCAVAHILTKPKVILPWWAVGSCHLPCKYPNFNPVLVGSWRSCLKALIFARYLIANEKGNRNILLIEPLLTPTWIDYTGLIHVTTNWAETGPAHFNN